MNKKKLLLVPFLAALAFAGCSNDEELADKGEVEGGAGQVRYLAVNIVTPKDSGVRAATDGGFESGSEKEDAVEKALFILLYKDADGATKVLQTPTEVADLEPWKGLGSYNPNVENISSAVIVVNGVSGDDKQTKVCGILAVLNPQDGMAALFTPDKPLSEVKEMMGAYAPAASENFIMTNSVYAEGSDIKIAADVTSANLAKSEDAAKNNPVDIYVERAVAKVKTSAIPEGFGAELQKISLNGKGDTELKIDIKGIQIANCAEKSYLFKNIDGFTTAAPWEGWNSTEYKRSYWANIPGDVTYENHSWKAISSDEGALSPAAAQDFYVQENVFTKADVKPQQHTSVILTAQLQKKNDAGNYEPFELVKIAGVYYTPADALTQIAGALVNRNYFIQKTTEEGKTSYESIPVEYLEWAKTAPADASDVKGWEGFAQLVDGHKNDQFYIYDAAYEGATKPYRPVTAGSDEDVNKVLQGKNLRVMKWTDGMCYYFVDIEHFGKIGENNVKGIIRNHIYNLTLKSLTGVGVPVFNPEAIIIPEKPDETELFYLAARIDILKWKVVNQDIEFDN